MGEHTPIVLVVEDDEAICQMMRVALESEGYRVRTLDDGQQVAETLLTAREPYVVLLDLMMPQMSGDKVCAALAGDVRFARHAVAVMTAGVVKPGEHPPIPARALLAKPFSLDQLYALVGSLVESLVESLQQPQALAC